MVHKMIGVVPKLMIWNKNYDSIDKNMNRWYVLWCDHWDSQVKGNTTFEFDPPVHLPQEIFIYAFSLQPPYIALLED